MATVNAIATHCLYVSLSLFSLLSQPLPLLPSLPLSLSPPQCLHSQPLRAFLLTPKLAILHYQFIVTVNKQDGCISSQLREV